MDLLECVTTGVVCRVYGERALLRRVVQRPNHDTRLVVESVVVSENSLGGEKLCGDFAMVAPAVGVLSTIIATLA